MTYPTISTVVSGDSTRRTLEAASACARAWQSTLDVLCVAAQPFQPDFMMPGLSATVIQASEQDTREVLDQTEAMTRQALVGAEFGWTCRTLQGEVGMMSRSAAQTCRFADVAVLARPDGSSLETDSVFEATLFNTSVPILLLPEGRAAQFDRVAIAWDGSTQALATVRAALPLLVAAAWVDIVMIDPSRDTGTGFAPGEDLARMLSRHGIHPQIVVQPRMSQPISEMLVRHMTDRAADLLVMGAYGHSRLRERLLGGVTRDMLARSDVPLFLAR